MWKGILYTVIFFAVILLVAKLFFWMLPYLLIGGLGIYVYKKCISPKLNNKKKDEGINYTYTKKIEVEKQNFNGVSKKPKENNIIDVDYKEINK